jgi:hypothetical protein
LIVTNSQKPEFGTYRLVRLLLRKAGVRSRLGVIAGGFLTS